MRALKAVTSRDPVSPAFGKSKTSGSSPDLATQLAALPPGLKAALIIERLGLDKGLSGITKAQADSAAPTNPVVALSEDLLEGLLAEFSSAVMQVKKPASAKNKSTGAGSKAPDLTRSTRKAQAVRNITAPQFSDPNRSAKSMARLLKQEHPFVAAQFLAGCTTKYAATVLRSLPAFLAQRIALQMVSIAATDAAPTAAMRLRIGSLLGDTAT